MKDFEVHRYYDNNKIIDDNFFDKQHKFTVYFPYHNFNIFIRKYNFFNKRYAILGSFSKSYVGTKSQKTGTFTTKVSIKQ